MLLIDRGTIDIYLPALAWELSLYRRPLALVPILTGAMPFAVDLLRQLPTDTIVEPMMIKSYGDATTPEKPTMALTPTRRHLQGRKIVLLDDILDRGASLDLAYNWLTTSLPTDDILPWVLLRKVLEEFPSPGFSASHQDRRPLADAQHYPVVKKARALFDIGSSFVVGYGLDHRQQLRGLLDIHVVHNDDPKCPQCGVNMLLYGCWCDRNGNDQMGVPRPRGG